MIVLIRLVASSLPLIALPALAAEPDVSTGITNVGPAAFIFTIAGALLLTLVFRSAASHLMHIVIGRIGTLRIRRALEARSPDVLHDFILPGAYGGLTKIDHAILTAGGVLCIQTKHLRRRFLNPLIQNEGRTRALQNVVPDVPVANVVVFTGTVDFPTPPPKNVMHVGDLDSFIAKFV